ncbi:hypothetical protein BX600DRAFT_511453 [Xylariales sp. PMI_506]|nr:hypothetical protein BX600DRAFT_511453 [Xylariales sp. PMI_506]
MSSRGAESPPPETQSGRQINDPPASGTGVNDVSNDKKKAELREQIDNLESNPRGILEDAVDAKFSKGTESSK